jgi:NPCBM/NEW2 domain
MSLSALLMISLLAAPGPDVQVQTSDGSDFRGALSGIDERGVLVRVGEEDRRVDLKSLISITLPTNNPEKPNTLVELTDHSQLAATDYRVIGSNAQIVLVGGAKVIVPTQAVRFVRFQAAGEQEDKANKQWKDITEQKATGDLLVVRKKGTLDYLEGVHKDLNEESLTFELDREPIKVKRPKIEGLIYYHSAAAPLPDATCQVAAVGGTRLFASSVNWTNDQFKVATVAGAKVSLPHDQVVELDFSAGKLRYLSDLETETAEYTPLFPTKEPLAALTDFFQPRQDMNLEQGPLKLDGKTYRKGLAMHSRSRLVYRLPGDYNRLTAVAGIDDSVREGGNVRLEIRGDGKSLWQGTLRGSEPGKNLDIALAGVRRLEIVVDFGDDLDIADQVDLCDAKVSK